MSNRQSKHYGTNTAALGAVLAALLLAPAPHAFAAMAIDDAIGLEDLPAMDTRLFRPGPAAVSKCGTSDPFPGAFKAGPYAYKTITTVNNGPTRCVTVIAAWSCPLPASGRAPNAYLSAYLVRFNPQDIQENFLAGAGVSTGNPTANARTDFSFEAPANTPIILVVHQTNSAGGGPNNRCSYHIASKELDLSSVTP